MPDPARKRMIVLNYEVKKYATGTILGSPGSSCKQKEAASVTNVPSGGLMGHGPLGCWWPMLEGPDSAKWLIAGY